MSGIGGLVLAGGRSRRFGREKAAAELDGLPMLAVSVAVLARGCEAVAVSARPGSWAAAWAVERGLPVLADSPDLPEGPLAGLAAGLAWATERRATLLTTAPCDTPRLPPDLVARLAERLGTADAAVARSPEGLEPLCALWRVAPVDARLAAMLAEGHPPVHRLLSDLGAVEAAFSDARAFGNINTPADLAAARERP